MISKFKGLIEKLKKKLGGSFYSFFMSMFCKKYESVNWRGPNKECELEVINLADKIWLQKDYDFLDFYL